LAIESPPHATVTRVVSVTVAWMTVMPTAMPAMSAQAYAMP
jgi:hypothetical protein